MNCKRRRDDLEAETQKLKNYITENDKDNAVYSTSNEWPIYSHPEGGLVKITPWGSLRQFTNPETGELITKFEDSSFQDQSFNMANLVYEQMYNVAHNSMNVDTPERAESQMPPTPQSIQQCKLSTPTPVRMYPGDEVETYVLNGYDGFNQEHENYFGMQDEATD